MIPFLPYIVKSTIILIVLLGYYQLVLQKQTFYNTNRFYLLGILLMAQLIPFIQITTPFRSFMESQGIIDNPFAAIFLTDTNVEASVSTPNYWIWIYFSGVIVVSVKFALAILQLRHLVNTNPSKKIRGIRIVFLPRSYPNFSFFHLLFVNQSVEDAETRQNTFAHEKIHIRQLHSLDLLFIHLFCLINWFNPFAWLLKRAIIQNHEFIADHRVIQKYQTEGYLRLILSQSFKTHFSFTNHFACSNLKKRIIMMTKQQTQKYKVWNYVPATLLCGFLFITFSCQTEESNSQEQNVTQTLNLSNVTADTTDTFVAVQDMPVFPEGDIVKWINQKTKYPAEAQRKGVEGKVAIQFIVAKDGSVKDIKIVRGVEETLNAEAVRVIQSMPKWKPGKVNGKAVNVSFTVPINFQIKDL